MAGHWTNDCTIVNGVVRFQDLAYLGICEDELIEEKVPHGFIAEWDNGNWMEGGKLKWDIASMTVVKQPKEQMIAIGEYGKAWLVGGGDRHEESIADGKISPKDRGTLRVVRAIEGQAYAAGMDRQVYRRDGKNQWTCIDESMRPSSRSNDVFGFEGIDGFSSKDIYAGGWNGEIWHYNGKKWVSCDSPTNLPLTNMICGGDGKVYACGRMGLLLQGKGNRWKVIEHESTEEDLWGLAWYEDKLWVASMTQLYTLEKNKLGPVEFEDTQPETCYHLSTADGVLWSIGPKSVFAFDGNEWTHID